MTKTIEQMKLENRINSLSAKIMVGSNARIVAKLKRRLRALAN